MELAGKTFRAVANSSHGTINPETTMTFHADKENVVLGTYGGGTIKFGQVIAQRTGDENVTLLYQCVSESGEMKAGQARARFDTEQHETRMLLDWQWLTGDRATGHSEWILEK